MHLLVLLLSVVGVAIGQPLSASYSYAYQSDGRMIAAPAALSALTLPLPIDEEFLDGFKHPLVMPHFPADRPVEVKIEEEDKSKEEAKPEKEAVEPNKEAAPKEVEPAILAPKLSVVGFTPYYPPLYRNWWSDFQTNLQSWQNKWQQYLQSLQNLGSGSSRIIYPYIYYK